MTLHPWQVAKLEKMLPPIRLDADAYETIMAKASRVLALYPERFTRSDVFRDALLAWAATDDVPRETANVSQRDTK